MRETLQAGADLADLSLMASETESPCFGCKHYFVTWDKRASHGCKAFQFKSRDLPSEVVLRQSKSPCRAFEKNDRKRRRRPPPRPMGSPANAPKNGTAEDRPAPSPANLRTPRLDITG